ncbi:MAG: outer membrane protein assembly factor BamB family protein [Candidatus Thorarchaeota archaeon]
MKLIESAWPKFRANIGNTGRSKFSGPDSGTIRWKVKIGKGLKEPSVGLEGTVYVPTDTKLTAIDSSGEILWAEEIYGFRKVPLKGMTTPAIREDGSLIVGSLGRVSCLETDGSERWFHNIDGIPSAPNIGPNGTIYVSAWSFDWAGMYVISPEGVPVGRDDPKIFDKWLAQRHNEVSPASIDSEGNVFIAFHANYTHPEAYSWDPPDEVDESFFYAVSIFNPEGDRIGMFVTYIYNSGRHHLNAVCINYNVIHYQGGPYGALYVFGLEDLLALEVPPDKLFLRNFYFYESTMKSDKMRRNWISDALGKCKWSWHHEYNGGCEVIGYPVIGDDNSVFARIICRRSSSKPNPSTKRIDRFWLTGAGAENDLMCSTIKLQERITCNPVLDSRNRLYVGSTGGTIFMLDSKDATIVAQLDRSISSVIIGPEESIVALTSNGYAHLIA